MPRRSSGRWLALLLLSIAGCPPRPDGIYRGPTQSLDQVVAGINRNNRALPTLWARHYFEANIVEKSAEGQTTTFVNGGGALMVLKPRDFYFTGGKEGTGVRLVEMGSNNSEFWLTIPQRNTIWHGRHRPATRPTAANMPLRPDLVLEVLGIGDIDANLVAEPAPVLRFNNDERVYMIVWQARGADRWYAVKEIWYDLATLLPLKVLLFDGDGRVVLRANLSKHQSIALEGIPQDAWPKVATDLRLFFPQTRSTLWLELSSVQLQNKGRPRAGSIQYDPDPGFRIIEVEENPR
jgi:hypothetical protein